MQLVKAAVAGTMESGDIMVTLSPNESGGIQLELTSSVIQQYGRQIEAMILETLRELGVEDAEILAVDKGALDCTIKARVSAAVFRAAESTDYQWKGEAQ